MTTASRRLTPSLRKELSIAPLAPEGPPSMSTARESDLMISASPWPTLTKTTLVAGFLAAVLVGFGVGLGLDFFGFFEGSGVGAAVVPAAVDGFPPPPPLLLLPAPPESLPQALSATRGRQASVTTRVNKAAC